MKRNFLLTVFALLGASSGAAAQEAESIVIENTPISGKPFLTTYTTGTLRTKFEYQPSEGNARFDVRTARFGVGGTIMDKFDYMMEIDMSDEGKIKMVNAWVGIDIYSSGWRRKYTNEWTFNIGYMRVPFSIDAHRSPHTQLFANRSFIAKQVGNVRDVGATLGWKSDRWIPINIQAGIFNGSGLPDNLQTYWTRTFNYSAKVQAGVLSGVNLVAGFHTTKPGDVRMYMYDAGVTYTSERWLIEGEYLRKEYSAGAFDAVNSVDAFVRYCIPFRAKTMQRISFLGRYDYLDAHSNGIAGANGALMVNDPARHRATAGISSSLGLPFAADIRLNYEKYFYRRGVIPGPSDHDKIVLELMAHF